MQFIYNTLKEHTIILFYTINISLIMVFIITKAHKEILAVGAKSLHSLPLV